MADPTTTSSGVNETKRVPRHATMTITGELQSAQSPKAEHLGRWTFIFPLSARTSVHDVALAGPHGGDDWGCIMLFSSIHIREQKAREDDGTIGKGEKKIKK